MESKLTRGIVKYDAVIVGAGYGGLIAGAILSRNGLKTAVVEEVDQIGGRIGSTFHNGYWLDWGHRDSRDFGDNFLVMTQQKQYGKKAAEAAGAEIAWVGPVQPMITAHRMAGGKPFAFSSSPEDMMRFATEGLNLSPDQMTKLMSAFGSLAAEEPQKLIPLTFREWLPTLEEEALRKALLAIAQLMFSVPPEETSVGRFLQLMANPIEVYKANDLEVGGLQGVIEPYARAIRKYGGEIKLGLQTVDIALEGSKVTGIVVRDKTNMVQEFHAPVVVFSLPIWEIFKVLDESHFPREVVENARKLEPAYTGDCMDLIIGLSGVPTVRATGQPEHFPGWNQFLEAPSGWYIPSLASEKQAPPGKHVLFVMWSRAGPDSAGHEPFKSFKEGKAKVDSIHEYIRQYYSDLDEITEWVGYHWPRVWASATCYRPIYRSPLQVDGLDGLYLVSFTVEVDGAYSDIEANAALQATQLILQGRGK